MHSIIQSRTRRIEFHSTGNIFWRILRYVRPGMSTIEQCPVKGWAADGLTIADAGRFYKAILPGPTLPCGFWLFTTYLRGAR